MLDFRILLGKKQGLTTALLVLLWWLGSLAALGQTVPPRPNPPRLVNDLAGLLQAGQADALEQKLLSYNDSTSSQIAVVTVPTLDGSDIESYAQTLYQSWGIGQKGRDNGILILISAQEHKVRIQPGYGLEGAIPDAVAGRIIRETLAPAFKANRYYDGLDQATTELIARAKGEYKADPSEARDSSGGSGLRLFHSGSSLRCWCWFLSWPATGVAGAGAATGALAEASFRPSFSGAAAAVLGAAGASEAGAVLEASAAAAVAAAGPAGVGSTTAQRG